MNMLLVGGLLFALLLALGVGLFLSLMNVRKARLDLARRMGLISRDGVTAAAPGAAALALLRESGWNASLGRRLRAIWAFGLPRTWGMTAGAITLIGTAATAAGGAWLVLGAILHFASWIALLAVVVALFLVPRALLKHQQGKADRSFTDVFPDTIDMVIRMLRAGLPITAAVRAVGQEAAPPVNAVFTNLADQMAIGIAFEDALAGASERVMLADFSFFAVSVSLQRATGGNLATTLEILSDLMRRRHATRLKAKAATGEVRMSAYVLGGIPFFIIGGLLIMSPDYLAPLISDPRGKIIIAIATTSLLSGFAIIRMMMRSVTNVS